MRAVLEVARAAAEQLQVRFVDERRRLQHVPGSLTAHVAMRKPMQRVGDERRQLV